MQDQYPTLSAIDEGPVDILHDGTLVVTVESPNAVIPFFLRRHSYSASHALMHEGYSCRPTDLTAEKVKLTGPNGIFVELDATEVVPNNPGEGTPAMVYYGKHSGTYWCAAETGELGAGEYTLHDSLVRWLQSDDVANIVDRFMAHHTERLTTSTE